jgi:hypothetical protein
MPSLDLRDFLLVVCLDYCWKLIERLVVWDNLAFKESFKFDENQIFR